MLVDAAVKHPLPTGACLIRSRSRSTADLVASLSGRGDVVYAEPNYVVRGTAVPNDPYFPNEWFLNNSSMPRADISAPEAWDVTTGSAAFVVAAIDTGSDHRHVDLVGNLWTAPSAYTIDVNGSAVTCPAGSHGFDTITGTCDAVDPHGHGTAMAGIIGAVGNNATGGTGVNWRTSIMDLRFLGPDGRGFISNWHATARRSARGRRPMAWRGRSSVRTGSPWRRTCTSGWRFRATTRHAWRRQPSRT
jgi:hypothetical protein